MNGDHRHDELTGLPSRLSFESALVDALASYAEAETREIVAVIIADVDDFKEVNDMFGMSPADEVLKSVARLLQDIVRDDGVVCRYACDEFLVLCAPTTEARAQQLARRIESEVRSLVVNSEGLDIGPISLSTGLAYYPRDGRRATDLIQAAEVALSRRKGRDNRRASWHS